jgi:3-hydroxyisobutyrate dehydrogenase-like beta-hydroxyacid dehydrogenase
MREMMTDRRQSRDSIAIGNKDLSLAAGLGQSLNVDTPIATFVSQLES